MGLGVSSLTWSLIRMCRLQGQNKFCIRHIIRHRTYYRDILGEHGDGINPTHWLEQDQGISLIEISSFPNEQETEIYHANSIQTKEDLVFGQLSPQLVNYHTER
jgi:hypothetical protein